MLDVLPPGWVPALATFAAVALGVVCLSLLWEGIRRIRQQQTVSRRLEELTSQSEELEAGSEPRPVLFTEDREESTWLASVLVPRRADLSRLLSQADVDWGVGTFVLLTLGLAVAAGVGSGVLFRSPAAAVLFAAGGAAIPYLYVRRRRTKRYESFEESLPEAIELLGRSLRAGHALVTGLEVVAEEAPAPVDREFRQVFEEQRFGLPLKESLLGLADRVDTVDVQMFVTAVMIQRESGGNLAEILDNLAGLIRERIKFQRQLRVHTAEGRMTGYLLAFLPVLVGGMVFLINREYMMPLFVEPAGRSLLVATFVLQIIGFLWIRKIVDLEF